MPVYKIANINENDFEIAKRGSGSCADLGGTHQPGKRSGAGVYLSSDRPRFYLFISISAKDLRHSTAIRTSFRVVLSATYSQCSTFICDVSTTTVTPSFYIPEFIHLTLFQLTFLLYIPSRPLIYIAQCSDHS